MAYLVQSPTDGQLLGRTVVPDTFQPRDATEFVFTADPAGKVWDASAKRPRDPQQADTLAAAKATKRRELILAADAEYASLWSMDGEVIELMKDRILFKAPANRTAAENAKLQQAAAIVDKLTTKLTEVTNATTVAQVATIAWGP